MTRKGLFWLIVFLPACDAPEPERPVMTEPWFADVAAAADLDFVHVRALKSRYWLPEIMSGGAAWLDFDGDGDPDLYLVQGGALDSDDGPPPVNRMYRNEAGRFVDVTDETGTGHPGYGMGATVGDYDRDGDLDLYVTNVGANVLYRNDGGRFVDVSDEAGVGHTGWGTSATWLDFDLDGDLDLFVTNYVNWAAERELECYSGGAERDYCHPRHFNAPAGDVLYRNDGGRFTDVTGSSGIWTKSGYGLGVVSGDFDADGRIDLYVANDGMPNQLWMNRGDGTFEDRALISGAAVNITGAAEAGMGIAMGDLENDGDTDLFVTHLRGETNTLYLNGGGVFEDVTATTGLAAPSVPLTGFGTGFVDFDNDGILDVYVGNGRVGKGLPVETPFAEPNQVFRGSEDLRFVPVSPPGGTSEAVIDTTRAVAFADYDGDGAVDLVAVNNGEPVRLLRNLVGSRMNWLSLEVRDTDDVEALDARVSVTVGEKIQWRAVNRSGSYLASHSGRLFYGLGSAGQADQVRVYWSDGSETDYGSLDGRQTWLLQRGQAAAAIP